MCIRDRLTSCWTNAIADNLASLGYVSEIRKQRDFYAHYVHPLASKTTRAFVIVSDALRYEVAVEPVSYTHLHPGAYAEGQEFGSLLIIDELEPKPEQSDELTLFDGNYGDELNTWNFRSLLARQYDVVVTNPPYMGSSNMNDKLSKFVKDNHPDAKGDLFSCFIERGNRMANQAGCCLLYTSSPAFMRRMVELLMPPLTCNV